MNGLEFKHKSGPDYSNDTSHYMALQFTKGTVETDNRLLITLKTIITKKTFSANGNVKSVF